MDPVSQADRLAALLRQRLLERGRTAGASATARDKSGEGAPVDEVYAAVPVEPSDDRQRRRTLIQTILSQEFGTTLINEAGFQQVIDRVLAAIEGDEEAASLLARVTRDVAGG